MSPIYALGVLLVGLAQTTDLTDDTDCREKNLPVLAEGQGEICIICGCRRAEALAGFE